MFCLSDVCKVLGLTQPSKVKERLNEKGVNTIPTLTSGGTQELLYINESNLYKTIFQSRKECAERFSDWVTSEVLPSIRKNGGYIMEKQDGKLKPIAKYVGKYFELKEWVTNDKSGTQTLITVTGREKFASIIKEYISESLN